MRSMQLTKRYMQNYTKLLMKQVNPRFGLKLGSKLNTDKLDAFNDAQITQLYELFLETNKEARLGKNNNNSNTSTSSTSADVNINDQSSTTKTQ